MRRVQYVVTVLYTHKHITLHYIVKEVVTAELNYKPVGCTLVGN